MTFLDIKKYPDKILRQKSLEIQSFDILKIEKLISNMSETMLKSNGIGLAAPQVGALLRLFVVNTRDGILTWLNPKIISFSLKKEVGEEGCLSIPGVFGNVKRSYKIKVVACNIQGKKIKFTAEGLYARVIQHEVDHLEGVLFIDRSTVITQGSDLLEKYKKNLDNKK